MSPPSVIREEANHAANSDVQEFAVLTVAVDLQGHIFQAPKLLAPRILKSLQTLMHSTCFIKLLNVFIALHPTHS